MCGSAAGGGPTGALVQVRVTQAPSACKPTPLSTAGTGHEASTGKELMWHPLPRTVSLHTAMAAWLAVHASGKVTRPDQHNATWQQHSHASSTCLEAQYRHPYANDSCQCTRKAQAARAVNAGVWPNRAQSSPPLAHPPWIRHDIVVRHTGEGMEHNPPRAVCPAYAPPTQPGQS